MIEDYYEWQPTWTTEAEMSTVMSLFLYGRGKAGGTDEEMEEIYQWAEEVRMNQFLLDNCLQGLMIPTFTTDGEFAFKITEKGAALAHKVLKIDDESGLVLLRGSGKDNGNGNGNGNSKK